MTSIKEVSREKAHTDASDTVRVDFPFSRRIPSDCGRLPARPLVLQRVTVMLSDCVSVAAGVCASRTSAVNA
jgi:hypothetical protein